MSNNSTHFNFASVGKQSSISNGVEDNQSIDNDLLDERISQKSRRTAIFLWWLSWFFVGMLHNIYVGKIGKAIFYFFTIGGFYIGFFIDGYKLYKGTFTDRKGKYLVN